MTTTIVLIRHAKPDDGILADDITRPISQEGRLIQKTMCQVLKDEGLTPTMILHSPLTRTKQTAEIIATSFQLQAQSEEALGSYFDENELIKKIPDPKANKVIFMIGHAPSLLRFANRLVGKSCPIYDLDRSGAIVLSFDDAIDFGKAKFLKYLAPPP